MKEEAQAETRDHHLAVIMVDIDMFKLVNDQYGHLVGDQVLTESHQFCLRGFGASDVAALIGVVKNLSLSAWILI